MMMGWHLVPPSRRSNPKSLHARKRVCLYAAMVKMALSGMKEQVFTNVAVNTYTNIYIRMKNRSYSVREKSVNYLQVTIRIIAVNLKH